MTRTLIIGDIHGCIDELRALCDQVGPDRIVSVGDMVDRGPDSEATWRFFAEDERASAIVGNHEQKCARWMRHELRPALSQRITRKLHGEPAWAEACAYFETLPRWIELDDVLVVHGFWEPGKPVHEQHPTVITGTMSGKGRIEKLGRPWYELYDGDKPLVVGHEAYDGADPLVYADRVYGVDTGCVRGGRLTGLVVPDFQLVSVPAKRDYWTEQMDAHPEFRFAGVEPAKLAWDVAAAMLPVLAADPETSDKADTLTQLLAEAEAAELRLLAAVEAEHAAAEAALPGGYDARAYARHIAGSNITNLLHKRRTRGFGRDELRARWSRPAELVGFVRGVLP